MCPSSLYSSTCASAVLSIPSSQQHSPYCRHSNTTQSNDFVQELPYELATLIFQHIPTSDVVECMYVCRSWRNYLSGWAEPWREVDIVNSHMADAIHPWIPEIHYHVRVLALSCTDASSFYKTMESIRAGYFQQLRSLQIYKCSATDLTSLSHALKIVGPNLQTLLIEFMAELIPIEQVMQDCPNLTELCYYTPLSTDRSSNSAIPTNTKIHHLQLHISNLRWQRLERILRAAPNVRYLSIQTCEVGGLTVINEYCTHLEFMCYNVGPYLIPWMKLLGREKSTTIGLSRDYRSSGRFGMKTAKMLASEFLDMFPEGIPKWIPMHTCGIDRLRGFRRGYHQENHPMLLAAVFRDNKPNMINVSARFLSTFPEYGMIRNDTGLY